MSFFHSELPLGFGLDVSSSSLKLVQLSKNKAHLKVDALSQVQAPKGMMVKDEIMDSKTFSYLLKQALDKPQFGHLSAAYAVVSLPESKSFVRVIQIPKMSDAEATSAVPFEAESFIPLPIDQVYLDWQKLSDEGDKMNLLIIATPKEFVEKYLGILDGAGIKVMAMEVESQSCHRALMAKNSKETSMIVDLDSQHSTIIMVEKGDLQFTSTVPIAGESFTDGIARALGVSTSKAEEIKRKVGLANAAEYPNIRTVLVPVLKNLSAEISNIINFHNEHSKETVKKIWLAGGGARLKNLQEVLQSEFLPESGVQVLLANPWLNLPEIGTPPIDLVESLSFTTAIGLSMRGVGII